MDKHELFDRIQTWNMLFDDTPLPSAQSDLAAIIRDQVTKDWDNGFLNNAAELEIITELKGTIVEDKLLNAIDLAKKKDPAKLKDIHSLLVEVQKFMYENKLM